jgi:hypothetical protein
MKIITLFIILAACQLCFADGDTNIIAMSDWSKPVSYIEAGQQYGSIIRGRLIIQKGGYSPRYGGPTPEIAVYVELQNVSRDSCELFFDDVQGLRCEFTKADGIIYNPTRGGGNGYGNGGGPVTTRSWVILPEDSCIRLRANKGGVLNDQYFGISLYSAQWYIRAGDTNDYYLSGTLTASSPTNHVMSPNTKVWQGTLTFPKIKISYPRQ